MLRFFSFFFNFIYFIFILSNIGYAKLEITWIDVAQGDASFTQFPVQSSRVPALIVDSGSSKNTSGRKSTVKSNIISAVNSFFSVDMSLAKTDSSLPDLYVIVTHGDEDHLYFLSDIIRELENRIGHELDIYFLLGGKEEDYCEKNKEGEKFLNYVKYRTSQPTYRHGHFLINNIPDPASMQLKFDDNTHLNILAALKSTNKNKNSIVSRLVHGNTSVMFTGDAPCETVSVAQENHNFQSSSTLLQLAHHGSTKDGANSFEWLRATQARYFVNSSGYTTYGHPHEGVFESFFKARLPPQQTFYLIKFSSKGDVKLLDHPGDIIPLGDQDAYGYIYAAIRMPLYSTIVQGNLFFTFDDQGNLEIEPSLVAKIHSTIRVPNLVLSQPLSTIELLKHYITPTMSSLHLNNFDFIILESVKENILNMDRLSSLSMKNNQLGKNIGHINFIKEIIEKHTGSLIELILIGNNLSTSEQEDIRLLWGNNKPGLSFEN